MRIRWGHTLFVLAFLAVLSPLHLRAEDEGITVESGSAESEIIEGEAIEEVAPAPGKSFDGFSDEEMASMQDSSETMEFQAEVNRLMDIIINSLYSNREIFIRELISNASDALDKIRFALLKDKDAAGETPLEIRIQFDKDAKTLTISDTGVGMSKDDLVKNLGTVAKSGTTDFVEKAASGTDSLSLIGQFGVGFYSVYLVSDEVTVVSKKGDDTQHVWKSSANQTFSVAPDPRGDTLPRGTSVTLKLKEDAEEFLNAETLEKLIKRYSQFIQFPIYLYKSKVVTKEVPVEPEPEPEKEETEDAEATEGEEDDLEVSDAEEEEEKDDKPKTKTVSETVWEWEHINTNKPIWTRKPSDIEEQEYKDFYKMLTKDTDDPLEHSHFSAEGEISFKSILYVPKKAPYGFYDSYYQKSTALKLYVRKVLISDEFEDFMPRYLSFIKGVVDSEDLPLNVSRETLQQSKVLRVMSKKLTRKAIALLRKMADDCEEDEDEDDEEDEDSEDDEEEKPKKVCKYDDFYKEFGKSIKLGILEDSSNKKKLAKLVRYETTKSEGKLISLQEYIENMPESQEYIYYITGESKEAVVDSPFIERLTRKGIEVVFMVDALDEYILNQIPEFDGVKLVSVSKEGMEIAQSEAAKEKWKQTKEDYKDFSEWLKEKLSGKVSKVEVSNRLTSSPCVLVTGKYGYSANMQRIMAAQTLGGNQNSWMKGEKIMEINPNHPLIKELKQRSESEDEDLDQSVELLFETSMITSGFPVTDSKAFADNILSVVAKSLGVESLEVELEPEDDLDAEEEDEEDDEEEDDEDDEDDEAEVEAEAEVAEDKDEL